MEETALLVPTSRIPSKCKSCPARKLEHARRTNVERLTSPSVRMKIRVSPRVSFSYEIQIKLTDTSKILLHKLIFLSLSPVFIVDEDFGITVEDHKTRARRKAKEALETCKQSVEDDTSLTAEEKIDRLTACMEQQLAVSMRETADEIQFQSSLRKRMGNAWSQYACRDTMNTTTKNSIVNSTWIFQPTRGQKQKFKTQLLFESDFSKIQRVQQFVTDQECQALLQEATPENSPTCLPLKAKSSSKVVGIFMEKMEQLVSFATGMSAKIEKEPLLQVQVTEPASNTKTTKEEDCSIGPDGSTTCSSSADDENETNMIRVSLANDVSVLASVLVLCETPKVGGEIFFTKTGTTLLPNDIKGDAIVILHEVDAKREDDPFVDEYVICPVREGRMFTLSEEMAK